MPVILVKYPIPPFIFGAAPPAPPPPPAPEDSVNISVNAPLLPFIVAVKKLPIELKLGLA